MNTKWLSGLFGLILFASSGAVFIGGCGDDEPTGESCQEGSFQCVEQELQKLSLIHISEPTRPY